MNKVDIFFLLAAFVTAAILLTLFFIGLIDLFTEVSNVFI